MQSWIAGGLVRIEGWNLDALAYWGDLRLLGWIGTMPRRSTRWTRSLMIAQDDYASCGARG
jgi:hypothetical protein